MAWDLHAGHWPFESDRSKHLNWHVSFEFEHWGLALPAFEPESVVIATLHPSREGKALQARQAGGRAPACRAASAGVEVGRRASKH